jgi:hypothetical protein
VGSIIVGKEAVDMGIINELGGIKDALNKIYDIIQEEDAKKNNSNQTNANSTNPNPNQTNPNPDQINVHHLMPQNQ